MRTTGRADRGSPTRAKPQECGVRVRTAPGPSGAFRPTDRDSRERSRDRDATDDQAPAVRKAPGPTAIPRRTDARANERTVDSGPTGPRAPPKGCSCTSRRSKRAAGFPGAPADRRHTRHDLYFRFLVDRQPPGTRCPGGRPGVAGRESRPAGVASWPRSQVGLRPRRCKADALRNADSEGERTARQANTPAAAPVPGTGSGPARTERPPALARHPRRTTEPSPARPRTPREASEGMAGIADPTCRRGSSRGGRRRDAASPRTLVS